MSHPINQPPSAQRKSKRPHRSAFTLVELMVVIAIIGILAAVLIPAVTGAIRTAKEAAIRTELGVIDQACEAYKLKYGDYPPDFSDWNAVERHFRKAFAEIDDNELKLLAQFTHLDDSLERVSMTTGDVDPRGLAGYAHYRQCIDPAEALVFCLGGYSSDKKKPFTGQGGPLSIISGGTATARYGLVQYNSERDNGFIDMASGKLSVFVGNDPTASSPNPCAASSAYTYSNDEYATTVSTGNAGVAYSTRAPGSTGFAEIRFLVDPFPVYTVGDDLKPVVYFNSRTYEKTFSPTTATGGWATSYGLFHNLNVYLHPSGDSQFGIGRPYMSTQLNTNAGVLSWVEKDRFQLISPGLDDSFGGSASPGVATTAAPNAAGAVTQYPTGQFVNFASALTGGDKYEDPESIYRGYKPQFDNITNFSTRTLESDLP